VDRSRKILDALGAKGIERVLHGVLDRPALVRAANACRLTYPGKRTQSVDTTTLVADLAAKVAADAESAFALVKLLDKICGREIGSVAALKEIDLGSVPSASQRESTRAAHLLYALMADPRESARAAAGRLLASPQPAGSETSAGDGTAALRARLATLEGSREESARAATEANERADAGAAELLAARKTLHALEGKLKRLSEENLQIHERSLVLSGRVEELEHGSHQGASIAALSAEVHRAIRENQKTLHEIRDLVDARLAGGADAARPYLEALGSTVRSVQTEIADLRAEREMDRRKERDAISDLAREVHFVKTEMAGQRSAAAERPQRRKGEPPRVGLFVDVQNMYYAARQLNARLDFGALIETISRERRLIRAIAYVVQNRDIDQSGFLAMLQQRNYEVRRKDLKVRADGSSKGDWDMGMALDILSLADSLDVVVLATGDGDFVPLVNEVKTKGPRVEVYSFAGSTAKELVEACDRHVEIDEGLLIHLSPAS
jgi:uncharacterized LabA/DUF88 family protein